MDVNWVGPVSIPKVKLASWAGDLERLTESKCGREEGK